MRSRTQSGLSGRNGRNGRNGTRADPRFGQLADSRFDVRARKATCKQLLHLPLRQVTSVTREFAMVLRREIVAKQAHSRQVQLPPLNQFEPTGNFARCAQP